MQGLLVKRKGSYSVEAAWIITITVIIIFVTIHLGFQIYTEAMDYIEEQCVTEEYDYVVWFRRISLGKEVVEMITE